MEQKSPTTTLDLATVKTYRYLRLSLVGVALFLWAAVLIEIAAGCGQLGSISAYYYTPVRSVFVGTLIVMGVGLIAIKGRENSVEDVLLNLAGMLAPVVALVPTVNHSGGDAACDVVADSIFALTPEAVTNNVAALLVVGALGWVLALVIAYRSGDLEGSQGRGNRWGLVLAFAGLVGFTAWFGLAPDGFRDHAHNWAAVPMFGLIAVVAMLNARNITKDERTMLFASKETYQKVYVAVAATMGLVLGLAVAGAVYKKLTDNAPFASWVFWVEASMLVLFLAFWVAQTLDWWKDGAPTGVTPAGADSDRSAGP